MSLTIATAFFGIVVSGAATEIEVPRASIYWDRIFISAEPSNGGTVSGEEITDYWGLYTHLSAVANRGYAFVNWTQNGNVVSSDPEYHISVNWGFLPVTPGERHLVANFVGVQYVPENTKYGGLFISSDEPLHTNSGFVAISTTASGGYSAKIWLNGLAYSGSGRFSSDGAASFSVIPSGGNKITVALQAQLGYAGFLTGVVSNNVLTNGWTAELMAYRPGFKAKTHPAPNAGRYTLIIPGGDDSSSAPTGCGFGTVSIDNSGSIAFSGTLGDGTKIAQKAFLSENGLWPFYSPTSGGSILGWLAFTNLPNSDFSGAVIWMKAPHNTGKLYPDGFTLKSDVIGSLYEFRVGATALNLTNGIIVLENGSLPQSITNELSFHTNNTITGANGLNLKVVATSGLLSGKMINPVNNKKISISGVVFQKQNFAVGLFTGANQNGTIYIGPEAN